LCQGARAVAQLVKKGHIDPDGLPFFSKSQALEAVSDPELVDAICQGCPFQAEDCDFQSQTVSPLPSDIEPCGGYILLRLLILNRYIDPSALKALNHD